MILRYFLFAFILGSAAWAKSPIRDVCGDTSTTSLKRAETIEDLEEVVCRTASSTNTSTSIIDLSKSVLGIIEKIKNGNADPKKWRENQELEFAVQNLAESIKQAGRSEAPREQTPLGEALYDLTKDYGSWQQRTADKSGYIAALKKAILLTKTGNEVYPCFSRTEGNRFLPGVLGDDGDEQEANKAPHPGYGGSMAFVTYPADRSNINGPWEKVLVFDWKMDPINAVIAVQHEFKHSCGSVEHVKCQKEILRTRNRGACDQAFAIDELKAYKFESEVTLELAKAAPELVCSTAFVSASYGGVPIRATDFDASNEEKIEDGTFADHLLSLYLKFGHLSSEDSFYEKTPDGGKKLRPDFIQKMKDAGFNPPQSRN
ncbi:hypothetical protein [Bdellovibrio sp. HCB337]|uniref:hypothetical protein n=1 Tax=Bdellovibrio sp. HCB337 TaxID=3394358 RepID=UPI0039A42355